eukprot:8937705-Pyramimonas_sp.AAC.1
MAGAPADSEAASPATEKEVQMMLYLQIIGNPTKMESYDNDHLRETRETLATIQNAFSTHLDMMKISFVAMRRSPGRQKRSTSRHVWRRVNRPDDDEDGCGAEERRMQRHGRARSYSRGHSPRAPA